MFKSNDGSTWKVLPASRLSAIEIWKGNRVIDEDHVSKLEQSLKDNIKDVNLNPFRIVVVPEDDGVVRYIVDGQHRVKILKQYFMNPEAEDFDVIVIEKECSNEAEIIELFKVINTTRSIQWKEDPVLVANKYVEAFVKHFNVDPKKPVVKTGKTVRPFMSVDKLRDALISKHVVDWKMTPSEFVENAHRVNLSLLPQLLENTTPMAKKAHALNFALGLVDFSWM